MCSENGFPCTDACSCSNCDNQCYNDIQDLNEDVYDEDELEIESDSEDDD